MEETQSGRYDWQLPERLLVRTKQQCGGLFIYIWAWGAGAYLYIWGLGRGPIYIYGPGAGELFPGRVTFLQKMRVGGLCFVAC